MSSVLFHSMVSLQSVIQHRVQTISPTLVHDALPCPALFSIVCTACWPKFAYYPIFVTRIYVYDSFSFSVLHLVLLLLDILHIPGDYTSVPRPHHGHSSVSLLQFCLSSCSAWYFFYWVSFIIHAKFHFMFGCLYGLNCTSIFCGCHRSSLQVLYCI